VHKLCAGGVREAHFILSPSTDSTCAPAAPAAPPPSPHPFFVAQLQANDDVLKLLVQLPHT